MLVTARRGPGPVTPGGKFAIDRSTCREKRAMATVVRINMLLIRVIPLSWWNM
jgi:hypothetical protein